MTFIHKSILQGALLLALAMAGRAAGIETVAAPEIAPGNPHYVGNRAPLEPARLMLLPPGSVEPRGWVREQLNRQREGLTGHLGEISEWLQKEDNAWLSKNGKGKYGWEELPYWLKGYIELAYIFNDPKMLAECKIWVEGTLASQRPDGDFGPDQRFEDGTRDYWANMVMLFCLQSYYEHSHDPRVLDLMSKYFRYQATVSDEKMLTGYWQKMRGGDNIYSIHWLYNRTGDRELLKLAEKIHRCTADWRMKDNLPNWHNVNIAQCFREPAQYFLQTRAASDLQAAYANFHEVRKRYGQVPGGMFGGDENCRAGYDDPRQGVETCGLVEQMLSDQMLFQITADPFWADHCEEVAFNSYPAAVMPDFKSLRYLTAPNMVVSDSKNHAPGIDNAGPFLVMNPFSCRCCQHNHSHGWPYFNKHAWMATADRGLCAALYTANEVRAKVADGSEIRISQETNYPFEDSIRFQVSAGKPVSFPLYLRVPAWCAEPCVALGGETPVGVKGGKFIRINREWRDGDTVSLTLPMAVRTRTWEHNHRSVSVDYGPLTFSLRIGERYDRKSSTETAIGDSHWQKGADPEKWPSFEIHPTTPWNYGLVLASAQPEQSFIVERGQWPSDNYPFTPESAPIRLKAKAKRVPEWTLDRHGLCAVLQDSPVVSDQPEETVTLIPMGAARLRVSAFPVIGTGAGAKRWIAPQVPKPPLYPTTASHCFGGDSVDAVGDGMVPKDSGDHSIPRLTFWPHRGGTEWVEYAFKDPKRVSEVGIYWFDDTGVGQCRLPKAWKVLYQSAVGTWQPVPGFQAGPVAKDCWNTGTFPEITTKALRVEVELQPGFSGGVLEWTVK
ncbi:MAG: glycoside hydrolase family 127 protein [Verrucomicrobia bacterium]|nr:glycoside hydrolase family 127 protein [Verrucomicrobiota bacterium]